HGKFPAILEDEKVGAQAREVYEDAKRLLQQIFDEKLIKGQGIFGLFPANSVNEDDIEIYDENGAVQATFLTLRQQLEKRKGGTNIALADFVAPKETGKQDYMGCFCVSAGFGTEELVKKYRSENDDYTAIMMQGLSDRLAEA